MFLSCLKGFYGDVLQGFIGFIVTWGFFKFGVHVGPQN